jgi:membrane protein
MNQQNNHNKLVSFVSLLKQAFTELTNNDPLRMAGATAFFTTFALPPILIILIQVLGLVFNPRNISQQLFATLSNMVGHESVQQLIDTLLAFRQLAQNWFITVGGFIFLIFVATTLFKIIKSSINQIWKIKVFEKRGVWKSLSSRVKSVLVILVAGVLFVFGLLAEAAQAYLGQYIFELSPLIALYYKNLLNYLLSIAIVTAWFSIVFRYLPDGRPLWKVAITGALVTSILFNLGKLVLSWLLTYSNINTVYGASGSIVLLLLFVFYSSLILYYGATFTKVWAQQHGMPISPRHYARHYHLAEVNEAEEMEHIKM